MSFETLAGLAVYLDQIPWWGIALLVPSIMGWFFIAIVMLGAFVWLSACGFITWVDLLAFVFIGRYYGEHIDYSYFWPAWREETLLRAIGELEFIPSEWRQS